MMSATKGGGWGRGLNPLFSADFTTDYWLTRLKLKLKKEEGEQDKSGKSRF